MHALENASLWKKSCAQHVQNLALQFACDGPCRAWQTGVDGMRTCHCKHMLAQPVLSAAARMVESLRCLLLWRTSDGLRRNRTRSESVVSRAGRLFAVSQAEDGCIQQPDERCIFCISFVTECECLSLAQSKNKLDTSGFFVTPYTPYTCSEGEAESK